MKTYRSQRTGFEINIPSGWVCPVSFYGLLLGFYKECGFMCRRNAGYFNVKRGKIDNIETIGDVQRGTIHVHDKDHVWRRCILCGDLAVKLPAVKVMLTYVRGSYKRYNISTDAEYLAMLKYRPEGVAGLLDVIGLQGSDAIMGPVVKIYELVFSHGTYTIIAALGLGSLNEAIDASREREAEYDSVVSSFRPLA